MAHIFRRAEERDLIEIVAMLADDVLGAAREDQSVPLNKAYLDAFAAIGRDENQFLLVVEADGQVAGCLQLSFIPGISRLGMWRGQIESVRIARDYRGQGLGRQMLEWAIGQCREKGCGLVQLHTDISRKDAIRFYEQLGFKASHAGMKLAL
ncbi:GNAT family N-acetyltransferase [Pseudochrobactrum algeriensis]|uniref:GNAT family N-acetyltransferase n=1 Tax=Pseudochrobactrum algeriensis TaxID=2834768 RepID=UPI001BCC82C7|nr:GNAT family N-acetyltransferase [Pseudochrobactrum algeriensis]MBX8813409.1 GNAT family N-acetyltransferase [Ochrobactrum sp. MR34]QVQ37736.1 GNAT family N-acetyltransferase [Pseudochrobactrum algeriensis]QVQ40956.1 GNAT family N-acetyltransferase [Pseudochrobactrum algeriensis]QVQ44880.1 GNAT family N-acetyltransferase [Pseudochrobactrum algeriensis]